MAKRGRPSSYNAAYCDQARKLCRLGATDVEIADFFGVSLRTVQDWKVAHPEFLRALKEAKAEADARVEASLFHRAVGYSHDAEKIFNNGGEITRVAYREHYPPDTTACIFWLKNRQPGQWRDKHEQEVSGRLTLEQLVSATLPTGSQGRRELIAGKASEGAPAGIT